jgi:hypothetical protein
MQLWRRAVSSSFNASFTPQPRYVGTLRRLSYIVRLCTGFVNDLDCFCPFAMDTTKVRRMDERPLWNERHDPTAMLTRYRLECERCLCHYYQSCVSSYRTNGAFPFVAKPPPCFASASRSFSCSAFRSSSQLVTFAMS